MAEEWAGVVHTTTTDYLKETEDHTIRSRYTFVQLEQRGRIKRNASGKDCQWEVEALQPTVEAYGAGGQLNFAANDVYRSLSVDWRGYKATDFMTEKEKLMNRGTPQLVDRYAKIMPNLEKSMRDKFGGEIFIDGYASGNENRMHGIESMMGAGTTVAADKIAEPSDTYGGKSTAVQDLGGTWTSNLATPPNAAIATDWPDGNGDSEYDYLAPKMLNWSSTNWGTGSTTWEDNCERVIRQGCIWMTLTSGPEGEPDVFTCAGDMYFAYCNKQAAKQRQVVPAPKMSKFGFTGVMQEGIEIMKEFDCPSNTGYFLNFDEMELRSLHGQLFMPRGPEYDIRTDGWLFAIGFFGNVTYNPKAFGKAYNYA